MNSASQPPFVWLCLCCFWPLNHPLLRTCSPGFDHSILAKRITKTTTPSDTKPKVAQTTVRFIKVYVLAFGLHSIPSIGVCATVTDFFFLCVVLSLFHLLFWFSFFRMGGFIDFFLLLPLCKVQLYLHKSTHFTLHRLSAGRRVGWQKRLKRCLLVMCVKCACLWHIPHLGPEPSELERESESSNI